MNEDYDFEIVPSTRGESNVPSPAGTPNMDRLVCAAVDNFDRILDIASTVAEIQKMQAQADVYVEMSREQRLMLEQETDDYVRKLNAETDATVNKAEVIRRMMNDYYSAGEARLTGEEFSKIISEVLSHMGDI